MKKLKRITVAEFAQEIWDREGVRVVFHTAADKPAGNYRYTRALNKTHTIAHLRDRIHSLLQISFGLSRRHGYTIILGDGSINPRSDMHLRTARKTYKKH